MTDETHYPNISSALLDIHRLLVIFLASESIAALPQKATMRRLCADIERDEITRILLALAATVRIVEDRTFTGALGVFLDTSCGDLVPDVSKPDRREVLDIREACNKILHSVRIEPARKARPGGEEVLNARILLHGMKRQGKRNLEWLAVIDVVKFCEVSAAGLELFAGSWRKTPA